MAAPARRAAKSAKAHPKPNTSSAARVGTVQVQVRMPADLLEALDAYVGELNGARSYPKLTRTDVMLGVVDWAIRTRPDWESRVPPKGAK